MIIPVYKARSKAQQWRDNSRTSRKTKKKKLTEAGNYRASAAEAAAAAGLGAAGVNTYVKIYNNGSNE